MTHCPCLQLLRHAQDLWCCLGSPMPAAAQGHVGPIVSSLDPFPPPCLSSETNRTCGVVTGPTAPCLPLLSDPHDLSCCLGSHSPFSLLRDPQHLMCRLGTHCSLIASAQQPAGPVFHLRTHSTLPAAAQGLAGPVVLSRDSLLLPAEADVLAGSVLSSEDTLLLPAYLCSGFRSAYALVSEHPAWC